MVTQPLATFCGIKQSSPLYPSITKLGAEREHQHDADISARHSLLARALALQQQSHAFPCPQHCSVLLDACDKFVHPSGSSQHPCKPLSGFLNSLFPAFTTKLFSHFFLHRHCSESLVTTCLEEEKGAFVLSEYSTTYIQIYCLAVKDSFFFQKIIARGLLSRRQIELIKSGYCSVLK